MKTNDDYGAVSMSNGTTLIHIGSTTLMRTESTTPIAYRLLKKKDGLLVLQGCYIWQEGLVLSGHTWKDIPTVEEA